MRLVYAYDSAREARVGDSVRGPHGNYVLQDWQRPRHPGSTGSVYVTRADDPDGKHFELYPEAVGLTWIEREDRT